MDLTATECYGSKWLERVKIVNVDEWKKNPQGLLNTKMPFLVQAFPAVAEG